MSRELNINNDPLSMWELVARWIKVPKPRRIKFPTFLETKGITDFDFKMSTGADPALIQKRFGRFENGMHAMYIIIGELEELKNHE